MILSFSSPSVEPNDIITLAVAAAFMVIVIGGAALIFFTMRWLGRAIVRFAGLDHG